MWYVIWTLAYATMATISTNYRKPYAISTSGGTGSLNNHMIRKHNSIYEVAKKGVGENETSHPEDSQNTGGLQTTSESGKITN